MGNNTHERKFVVVTKTVGKVIMVKPSAKLKVKPRRKKMKGAFAMFTSPPIA